MFKQNVHKTIENAIYKWNVASVFLQKQFYKLKR